MTMRDSSQTRLVLVAAVVAPGDAATDGERCLVPFGHSARQPVATSSLGFARARRRRTEAGSGAWRTSGGAA
jgi:hypothetical protein